MRGVVAAIGVLGLAASDFATTASCTSPPDTPVRIEGGAFLMGEAAVYAEGGTAPDNRHRVLD